VASATGGATPVASSGATAATSAAASQGTGSQIDYTQLAAQLGNVPTASKQYRFAYIPKSLLNEFWIATKAGLDEAAAKYGVSVDTQAPASESDPVGQLNIAQAMLGSGKYDFFFLSPQSDTNLKPFIDQAHAKGVKVIVINDSKTTGADVYVGTDQYDIGVMAAHYLTQKLPAGSEVALIEGQAGSPNGIARAAGFTDTVNKEGKLKLVASQPGNWDQTQAMNAGSDIMRSHPNLKGVYAANDQMVQGVVEAVKSSGKLGQIAIIGTDGTSPAKDLIFQKQLDATVAQFPTDEGALSIELALRLLGGQQVPAWVVSPRDLITQANIAGFICRPPASQANCTK
jgi:ABC-type sugar transport system substrate-binding protein